MLKNIKIYHFHTMTTFWHYKSWMHTNVSLILYKIRGTYPLFCNVPLILYVFRFPNVQNKGYRTVYLLQPDIWNIIYPVWIDMWQLINQRVQIDARKELLSNLEKVLRIPARLGTEEALYSWLQINWPLCIVRISVFQRVQISEFYFLLHIILLHIWFYSRETFL